MAIYCRSNRNNFFRFIAIVSLLLTGCNNKPDKNITLSESLPDIDPDYTEITISPDIAPLNFKITVPASKYFAKFNFKSGGEIEVSSTSGNILIPLNKWKSMMRKNAGSDFEIEIYYSKGNREWIKYKTITNKISSDSIDPYIYYRLLYPGYESWSELSINRRNTGNFKSEALIENTIVDENCVNCHAFNSGNNGDFLFHMRGSMGGTYFQKNGEFKKINLKTPEMKNGAVYPRWHPSGKYVAFSSNKIIQRFHSADNKKIEVSDLESSLVLYDLGKNEMMNIEFPDKENFMDTYPEWSPDGKWLYFCRAGQIEEDYDYRKVVYNLYRVSFDQDRRMFGETELIYDASSINKSVAFPRISPDGRFLVLTQFDYGCFPIWHKEADLYLIKLQNFNAKRLSLNSEYAESYHSWSSNSKWLVFSSKRRDGLTARPYISYIDSNGNSSKPFILPQEDPEFYNRYLKTFNIPEFSTIELDLNPGEIRKLSESEAVQAKWVNE